MLTLIVVVLGAGAVGGVVNALISQNGFLLPQFNKADTGSIWRPGVLGNILVGSVSAFISWALYGPLAAVALPIGQPTPALGTFTVTLSTLGGAVLVGVGGARWLTNEVDKKILKAAVDMASKTAKKDVTTEKIIKASPIETLRMVSKD